MIYYHCSPTPGLTVLQPRKPESFHKPAAVYLATLLPMALMYRIRNYEYTYGYTREGQIYLDEYFPNALELLYRGKSASLYLCSPMETKTTQIPNERISLEEVPILEEISIPDVLEALLEQERLGKLIIHRYSTLSQRKLDWILQAEADSIRELSLVGKDTPMAEYYRTHYPKSWAMVAAEQK